MWITQRRKKKRKNRLSRVFLRLKIISKVKRPSLRLSRWLKILSRSSKGSLMNFMKTCSTKSGCWWKSSALILWIFTLRRSFQSKSIKLTNFGRRSRMKWEVLNGVRLLMKVLLSWKSESSRVFLSCKRNSCRKHKCTQLNLMRKQLRRMSLSCKELLYS